MRHIGNLPTEEQASVFEDYMLASEIRVKVDPEDGEWAVWVIEEDQFDDARERLAQFREDPDNSRYNSHSAAARQIRREEKNAAEQFKKNQIDVRTRWSGNSSGLRAGPATKSLIGICVAIWLVSELSGTNELYSKLTFVDFDQRVISPSTLGLEGILSGQVWRIITPILIHYGPIHILFNMMALYFLGAQLEARLGPVRYLSILFAIGVISNGGEFVWERFSATGLSAFGGMSGVLYGFFGFIWMKVVFEPRERYILTRQTINMAIIWLFLCMLGVFGNIANAAHVVGLLVGVIFGYWNTFVRENLR
jgi:GlpG protein